MLHELWSDVRYRARALFRSGAMERELDTELRFHIEQQAAEFERRGMARDEARRQAQLAFGGLESMKEQTRDARGTAFAESLLQDLRYALRILRKEPGFSLTVVLILGLGIGANVSTFTVIEALVLRRLPVPHPETLVTIGDPAAIGSGWHGSPEVAYVSYPLFKDVRERNRVLSDIYAAGKLYDPDVIVRPDAGGDSGVEHPIARLVTGNYFSLLEVSAQIGRVFTAQEDQAAGGAPVAVIGYGYWQRRFAGDQSAVGRQIFVNRVPITIIGIMPAAFPGDIVGSPIDLWIPMAMQPMLNGSENMLQNREASWLQMMGRLAPGVTLAQARAAIATIEEQAVREHVSGRSLTQFEDDLKTNPIRVESGARGFSRSRETYTSALHVLMAAVALVVLVVCANVATLMVVRSIARGREISVRMTLGAGRGRLVRQLLTESLLFAVAVGRSDCSLPRTAAASCSSSRASRDRGRCRSTSHRMERSWPSPPV